MPCRAWLPRSVSVLSLGGVAIALSLLGLQVWNSDADIQKGFERALADRAAAPVTTQTAGGIVGSEEFWLSGIAPAHESADSKAKPVAIGDRMTLSLGEARIELSVDDIREIDAGIVNASTASKPQRALMLICRDVNRPLAAPVRLVIDAADDLMTANPLKARAL